jgi:hypothetical protein
MVTVNLSRHNRKEIADLLWANKSTGSISFRGANEHSYRYVPDPNLNRVLGLQTVNGFKKGEEVACCFWDTKDGIKDKGNAGKYTKFMVPIRGSKDMAFMSKATPEDLGVLINTANSNNSNNCRITEIRSLSDQGHPTRGLIKFVATKTIKPYEFLYAPYGARLTRIVRKLPPPKCKVVKSTMPFGGILCDICKKRFLKYKKLVGHRNNCK